MWGFSKPLLVLLSVVLNGAFVAAWVTQALPVKKCSSLASSDDCSLFHKIGVTEEQIKEIKPRLARFRECSTKQCEEINKLRRELIDLIAAEKPDRALIVAKQSEILEGQRKMQKLVVEQLLTEKSVLTPEQQKAFFEMIRSHCGCSGAGKELGLLLDQLPRPESERPAEATDDRAPATPSPRGSS